MPVPLKLFVKNGCPWCTLAVQVLDAEGYRYEVVDVLRDGAAFAEMRRLSGQGLAPTLLAGDRVLADFGPEELEAFLEEHGIEP